MRKALERARRDEARLDLTPMIDVVFQILIFFLCTLHYRSLEGHLDAFLPRDAGRARAAEPVDPVEVRIAVLAPGQRRSALDPARPWSGHGPYDLVGRSLEYRVGPRRVRDLEGLRAVLVELRRRRPEGRCALLPGPGTVTQDVIAVLDGLLECGFEDVAIASAPGAGPGPRRP